MPSRNCTNRILCAAALAALLLLHGNLFAANDHAAAHAAMAEGRADDALNLLRPMTREHPNDAEAQNLLCRVLMSEERADDAVPACERAVAIAPNDAQYQLALAHADGSKAEHASPFTALSIARRARDHFEAAARIAPGNWSVLSDLGEYYAEAPGIAGGGVEKARRLLPQLMKLNPARGHWLAARIAEETKDFSTAEQEFKLAVATGLNLPEGLVNLAEFYRKHNRNSEAEDCIRKAEAADTAHDPVLVDAATQLQKMGRNDDLALHLLRLYLASANRTEDAPAFAVHTQIGQILQREGNRAAADREYNDALALAHDYAPAQKALHSH